MPSVVKTNIISVHSELAVLNPTGSRWKDAKIRGCRGSLFCTSENPVAAVFSAVQPLRKSCIRNSGF